MKYRERIVKVLLLLARHISVERDCKVISQRVHYNDNSLVKALWVPAAIFNIARGEAALQFDRRDGAFGAVLEDEAGQEEAGAEEVDTKRVEDAGLQVSFWHINGHSRITYAIRVKNPTIRACCALNCSASLLFSSLGSGGGAFASALSAIVQVGAQENYYRGKVKY